MVLTEASENQLLIQRNWRTRHLKRQQYQKSYEVVMKKQRLGEAQELPKLEENMSSGSQLPS